MRFCCECSKCGERWWCNGVDEEDTNCTVLTGPMQNCPECGSDEFQIIDREVYSED